MLQKCITANDHSATASLYVFKMMIHYYYDDFKLALEYSKKAEEYASGLLGQFTFVFLKWFTALSHIKLLQKSTSKNRLKIIRNNYKLLAGFAKHAPANHSHRVLLIKAELARYNQNDAGAISNYEQSIKTASENGFIQDEALASECAGEFYIDKEKKQIAKIFLSHAFDCYQKWGALRKVEHLKEKYPFLPDIPKNITTPENIVEQVSRIVDVSSVISASQAISKEIVLHDLIDTVLKIAIQNSGAQRGLLFFTDSQENFQLKAIATFNNQNYQIEQDTSTQTDGDIIFSNSILDYAARSKSYSKSICYFQIVSFKI